MTSRRSLLGGLIAAPLLPVAVHAVRPTKIEGVVFGDGPLAGFTSEFVKIADGRVHLRLWNGTVGLSSRDRVHLRLAA